MGYPVNPDGSFIYDHPQPTPQRLSDEQAGYDAPGETALAFVLSRLEVKSDELDGQPFWYTELNGTCVMVRSMKAPCDLAWRVLRQEVTALCQEYAAQAVAAREAAIVAALETEKEASATAIVNLSRERHWKSFHMGKESAFTEAIDIIRKM